jgi:plastocyanin
MIMRCVPIAFVTTVAMLSSGALRAQRVLPVVPTVTVTAHEFAFDAPDSIMAGPTTIRFVSHGRQQHVLQFEKLASGHTTSDFARAFNAHEAMPWVTNVGGVGTVSPGAEAAATLDLTPGQYVMVCDIADTDGTRHSAKGMIRGLVVVDERTRVAMPTPDIVLDLSDYAFTLSKPLTAGAHVVRVRNAGPQSHMALLWRLDNGKSVADVTRWINGGPGSAPMTTMGGVPDLDRGQSAEMVLDLAPGRYMLICLDDDIHDQKPHYAHGMVREIVISAK